MTRKELEVYSEVTNQGVVRMPHRGFPGLVLQGDSLSCLLWRAMAVLEGIESGDLPQARLDALDLAEALEGDIEHYEKVLRDHDIEIPYDRDPKRCTKLYGHWRNQGKAQRTSVADPRRSSGGKP